MRLKTLGGLELEGGALTRKKPLLLLAFLALEGAQPRRYLAELFFGDTRDPYDGLSSALYKIRREAAEVCHTDEEQVFTTVQCDARTALDHLEHSQGEQAFALYGGAFLAGLSLHLNEELEEWVFAKREELGRRLQSLMIRRAEERAARGDFAAAGELAAEALGLSGAPEPDPEQLGRLLTLFVAADHPLAARIRELMAQYDIDIALGGHEARGRLQQVFLGRDEELGILASLAPGEWAWVQGGVGIGKSALLRQLDGRLLPARSGLPYATLEPLLGAVVRAGDPSILRRLLEIRGTVCIDDWEAADTDSREILKRLRKLNPEASFVIGSHDPPELPVHHLVMLRALPSTTLDSGDSWEQTRGIPHLVAAFRRGASLTSALATILNGLTPTARQVYLTTGLADRPNPSRVRQALELSAPEMALALEDLSLAGLIEPGGKILARNLAAAFLAEHPSLQADLAFRLARRLPDLEAVPLFRLARALWTEEDIPRIRSAYLAWSRQLLARGFPQRAAEVLNEVPLDDSGVLSQARALERAGHYREALDLLADLPGSATVLALRGALYWRLGRPDEAERSALAGLEGDFLARAIALYTLGELRRSSGEVEEAVAFYRRSAALWQAVNEPVHYVMNLSNVGATYLTVGRNLEGAEQCFREALAAAGSNPELRIRILTNLAIVWEQLGRPDDALAAHREILELARELGLSMTESRAWNNIGLVHHNRDDREQARPAYRRALALAHENAESYMIGIALGNLAELDEDFHGLREAIHYLRRSGHEAQAIAFEALIPEGGG